MKNFTLQHKSLTLNEKARTITVTASTETVDRYGDIVRIAGINCENYMKNPVVLWAHDANLLPIGKAVDIQKTGGANPQLLITIQFATAAENPEAEKVFQSYKGGYLNAVSIGFLPKQYEMRIEDGLVCGLDFLASELLELSCVPVPANPEALAKGMTPADLKALFHALTAKPANKSAETEFDRFIKQLCAPPAGSVKEFIQRGQ